MTLPAAQHIYKKTGQDQGLMYAWFFSMHTRVDMILCGTPEPFLLETADEIYAELERIEKVGNYYSPESELYKLNRDAAGREVAVGDELFSLIETCLSYHKKTEGCFDITVNSHGYHSSSINSVVLNRERKTICYKEEGTTIDLSGVLKGYALDKIKEILHRCRITDALVNMGNSSVLAIGNHPNGEGWKVGFAANGEHVLLRNQCLSTSGNETEERKHILSPATGEYVKGKGQVAIVTDDGTTGEILSTALFAATPAQRERLNIQYKSNKLWLPEEIFSEQWH